MTLILDAAPLVASADAREAQLGGTADIRDQEEGPLERFGTDASLSFDQRHFRTVVPLQGGSFALLPADF